MVTISHALINAALAKRWGWRGWTRSGFIWGAIAPDLPFALLVVGTFTQHLLFTDATWAQTSHLVFQDLYFNNPWWKAISDVLHAPISIAGLWGGIWLVGRRRAWYPWVSAFFLGVCLHVAIDIPTHFNDGPLLLWPLEWNARFYSPISYHDAAHFGRIFNVFEIALDFVLVVYLLHRPQAITPKQVDAPAQT